MKLILLVVTATATATNSTIPRKLQEAREALFDAEDALYQARQDLKKAEEARDKADYVVVHAAQPARLARFDAERRRDNATFVSQV